MNAQELRLFLALCVPDGVRERVVALQTAVSSRVPAGEIRWTEPEQLHVTLKFLGHVAPAIVSRLQPELHTLCSQFAPLRLTATGLGFFPKSKHPRILWAGVAADALSTVQSRIEALCCSLTGEEPENNFYGHITLARIKNLTRRNTQILSTEIQRFAVETFGEWLVSSVDLVQSRLSPQGSKYSTFARFPLRDCVKHII